MQIQRIQTLMLVLAIAALIVFLYVPYGYWDIELTAGGEAMPQMIACGQPVMLWFTVLTCVVILCSIFLYNKMPLQKSLVAIAAVMVVALACVVVYNLTRPVEIATAEVTSMTPAWGIGGLMLVAALVGLVAAYRGISRDQKLLRSYNSLR
ncbi:MAG: DUF4293 domain-containing protein [Paramuribaculum sp.]|nr:DUF4293 domain-containing protein [Paramuribaculum sp.]MDE6783714.1 DUF4293 domain-containing protein [Paramuribaculum sp.]